MRLVGKQLLRLILLLAGVTAAAFFLVAASPMDPLKTNVGQAALGSMTQEQIQRVEAYWGVGTPLITRFFSWTKDLLRGDLGVSLLYHRPVAAVIGEKLSNSLGLMLTAWLISGCLGFILGILAGIYRGKAGDKLISSVCLVLSATPSFWLALVFLMIFAVWFPILPVGLSVPVGALADSVTFLDRLRHAILPALTLSIAGVPAIALHTRGKIIQVMESDYVMFARARGESERRVVLGHGLRNIALPAMTLQFASISEILGGSVLVEQVFSYPGLGQAAIAAGLGSDVPLLLGITLTCALLVFGGNLAADLLYGVIDPRMKQKREGRKIL